MGLERGSYPPAENLKKMIEGMVRMRDVFFPSYFSRITSKPEKWPKELYQLYRRDKKFFKELKSYLPQLNYDQLNFLRRHLGFIEIQKLALRTFIKTAEKQASDMDVFEKFKHFMYKISPMNQPVSFYVLSNEGEDLINFYREENLTGFYSLLFLKFLSLTTPFLATIIQNPITLNLGRKGLSFTLNPQVENAFDRVIKPHFVSREDRSTESKNIRRWFEYFNLLYKYEGVFRFDVEIFKTLLVGAIHTYLTKKFLKEGSLVKWGEIYKYLTDKLHLDPEIIEIEELIQVILDANDSIIQWIPSERGDIEFRNHKGKQVLEISNELAIPGFETIKRSDFLKMPSIPKIENIDIIKTSRLDEFWRGAP